MVPQTIHFRCSRNACLLRMSTIFRHSGLSQAVFLKSVSGNLSPQYLQVVVIHKLILSIYISTYLPKRAVVAANGVARCLAGTFGICQHQLTGFDIPNEFEQGPLQFRETFTLFFSHHPSPSIRRRNNTCGGPDRWVRGIMPDRCSTHSRGNTGFRVQSKENASCVLVSCFFNRRTVLVLVPLCMPGFIWHLWQKVMRFSGRLFPPFEMGILWCASSSFSD